MLLELAGWASSCGWKQRSIRARKATKVANAAKHDKAISVQPERSEDTAQIDDVELETNSNVQSTWPSRGGYTTHGAMLLSCRIRDR